MIMRKIKKNQRDDRGVALISVMICVTLCFLLSATIMRVSFLSFLQKSVKKASVSAFYSNEAYMDDLREGMQEVAARAIVATASTTSNKSQAFINNVASQISSASSTQAFLESLLDKTNGGGRVKIKSAGVAVKESGGKELVIKDVVIEYESFEGNDSAAENGYYSEIKTDIRFRAPYYEVSEGGGGGGTYSMFAGSGAFVATGIANPGDNQLGNFEQRGNVYIGYDQNDNRHNATTENSKLFVNNAAALTVKQGMSYYMSGESIIINGDVYIDGKSSLIFAPYKDYVYEFDANGNIKRENGNKKYKVANQTVIVRGTIYLSSNCHLVISNRTSLTCKDIVVGGKSVQASDYTWPSEDGIDGLPIITSSSDRQRRKDWDTRTAGIGIYTLPAITASIASTPTPRYKNGSTDLADSLPSTIHFQANIHPVANVGNNGSDVTTFANGKIDRELASIVNVTNLNKFAGTNAYQNKNPKTYFSSGYYSENASTGQWTVNYSQGNPENAPNCYTPGSEKFQKYFDASGTLKNCTEVWVNIGSNVQISNLECPYFMINWSDSPQTFGRFNGDGNKKIYGMYICKSRGEFQQMDSLTVAVSFYDYWSDVEQIKYILHSIGAGEMSANSSEYNYCLINNMFKGGIKTLYPGAGGSTGEETKGEVVLSGRNMNLDIVSFENWGMQ
jgi:hypothetical protein